ncbi:hypothetical protein BpHYR1_011142 [Brachionus plicatilis]|uniref:Uncharacterized protein n=1 Tax=Brachionus plicatilis TaxID=10195 RepID=A0A3M7SJP6_BRAPC|nr:hypothetical protein BpHYR1_011142 [Brachionus plicatilis]
MSIRQPGKIWQNEGTPLAFKKTISSRLLEFGLGPHEAIEKPLLTSKDRKARLKWFKEELTGSKSDVERYGDWSNL